MSLATNQDGHRTVGDLRRTHAPGANRGDRLKATYPKLAERQKRSYFDVGGEMATTSGPNGLGRPNVNAVGSHHHPETERSGGSDDRAGVPGIRYVPEYDYRPMVPGRSGNRDHRHRSTWIIRIGHLPENRLVNHHQFGPGVGRQRRGSCIIRQRKYAVDGDAEPNQVGKEVRPFDQRPPGIFAGSGATKPDRFDHTFVV